MISYNYDQGYELEIECPSFSPGKVSQWIKKTSALYGKKIGDISFVFCSDKRILEVNRQFLQHDYYTDIITFDYSEHDIVAGDLFVSLDTVKSNAAELEEIFEKEVHRVIIHGILHLCGQGDKTPEEQAEMTRKENLALQQIGY